MNVNLLATSYMTMELATDTVSYYVYDYSKPDFLSMEAYIFNSSIANCLTLTDVEAIWPPISKVMKLSHDIIIPKLQCQYPKQL